MKLEIRDGDEKQRQYLVLTPERFEEQDFVEALREFWHEHDR